MYIVIAILANLLVLVGTKWVQQTGDQYCADIAAANGVSLSDFLAWNNIKVSIATGEISFRIASSLTHLVGRLFQLDWR
jgi:hypothetical protein